LKKIYVFEQIFQEFHKNENKQAWFIWMDGVLSAVFTAQPSTPRKKTEGNGKLDT
jgi:hypothetical protein